MEQLKSKQHTGACRNSPPVYSEGESDSADEETKTAVVGKKQSVNQVLNLRAVVTLPEPATVLPVRTMLPETIIGRKPEVHRKIMKRLCRQLHPGLVECILGHLPVSTLWNTVMAINPTRWSQILSNNGNTNILWHGNHVDSSIGYIKTYTSTQLGSTCFLPPEHDLNRQVPPPRALEHTTNTWQALPRYPEPIIRHQLNVHSVSKGLILMEMLELHGGMYSHDYCHQMVIWNPVSQSRRQLPISPLSSYVHPDRQNYMEVLLVNPEKTEYRVVEFFESVNLVMLRRKRFPSEYRPKLKKIWGYTVYDSGSANWSAVQRPPPNISELRLNPANSFVSCDEGSVCFVSAVGIVCWTSTTDVWSQAMFPVDFFKLLRGSYPGCHVEDLLYANGKVYMIFQRAPKMSVYTHYIVSISLSDIQSGIASFQHVGRVRGLEKRKRGRSKLLDASDQAPKRNEMSPDELNVMQRPCARGYIYHWYMLPVGRSFHLCVVVYGRWLKRFDLDARVWTESLVEIPSDRDHNLATMMVRTVLQNGAAHFFNINYHPYIPSWVNV